MQNKILYDEIPKYCDSIDKDKKSVVELSHFQAKLYQRLIDNKLKPLRGIAYFIDMIGYKLLLLTIIFFARNLLLLAYFHRHDSESISKITFKNLDNNAVEVVFNSHKAY